jgi:hypothetical protein
MGRLPRKPPRLQTLWPPDPLILDNSFSTQDPVPQAEPPNVEPPPKRQKPSTGLRSAVLANAEASLGTYSDLFAARLASGVSFDQLCRNQRGSCDIHPNLHQLQLFLRRVPIIVLRKNHTFRFQWKELWHTFRPSTRAVQLLKVLGQVNTRSRLQG